MNLVVVSPVRARLREMCSLLAGLGDAHEVMPIEGGLSQLSEIPVHQEPGVFILDYCAYDAAELDRLEQLHHLYPGAACIVVTDRVDTDFLMRALRNGVREVLPLPLTAISLGEALARVVKKSDGKGRRNGKVLAFVACKGGSGTSFLAANLAFVLAENRNKVLLIDLNLQFGDAALFISDHKGGNTVADVAAEIERVDAAFLAASAFNVTPDFAVLAAPETPASARLVKAEHVDTLLRLARHHYDFVVVDAGRGLDAVSIRALDHADVVYPVLQLTLPFLRDGKRLLDAFAQLDYGHEKIRIVVNRFQKGGEIGLEDLKRALGHAVAHVVPNQFDDVAASVNQGVPIMTLAPSSPVTKALLQMAATHTTLRTPVPDGWLARFMHRG